MDRNILVGTTLILGACFVPNQASPLRETESDAEMAESTVGTTGSSGSQESGTLPGTSGGGQVSTSSTGETSDSGGIGSSGVDGATSNMGGDSSSGRGSESESESTGPSSECGNSIVEPGEACDDGVNDGAYGGCSNDCSALAAYCGDGNLDGVEDCDDGNNAGADGCSEECVLSGTVLWETQYDGNASEEDVFVDISQDASGNIYAVGSARVLSCTYDSGVVRKISADGGVVWTDEYVGTGEACENVWGRSVVVLEEDDIVVSSAQGATGTVDPATLLRRYGVVAEELVESWTLLENDWVHRPRGMVEVSGEIFVVGQEPDTFDENGGVARVSNDGDFIEGWSVVGPQNVARITSVDADSVGGYAIGAIWSGNDDYSIRSYDSLGALRWSRVLDEVDVNQGADLGGAIAYGPSDSLAVCSNGGDGDLRLRLYDADGGAAWTAVLSFGEEARARCFDVAIDPGSSDILVAGLFDEAAPAGIPGNGNVDAFVARYSSLGEQIWLQSYDGLAPSSEGGNDQTIAYAVEVADDGGILVAGSVGVLDGSDDPYTDAFVWKLVP